jgi:hypothetical protein
MAAVVVGEGFDASAHAQGGIEVVFGDVEADDDGFRHIRADWPQGETGGAAAPENGQRSGFVDSQLRQYPPLRCAPRNDDDLSGVS